MGHLRGGAAGECAVRRMHCGDPVADTEPVAEASEADSAEMITKREVGRFRQVKSKKDACPLEWWRDKGSVAPTEEVG